MKFPQPRSKAKNPLSEAVRREHANPEAAMAKLLEIANALEADHAGRLSVAIINRQFRAGQSDTVPPR
jgi:hypothetical protein